jgi:anthranilate/para-aminobenzoate synthase component II
MLLLIDNYDSFTYNLLHYLGSLGADVVVRRNDALDVQQAMAMRPAGILLSPGPCDPDCRVATGQPHSRSWQCLEGPMDASNLV